MRTLIAVCAVLLLGPATATAQPSPRGGGRGEARERGSAVDPFSRTAFDEYALAGSTSTISAFSFSEPRAYAADENGDAVEGIGSFAVASSGQNEQTGVRDGLDTWSFDSGTRMDSVYAGPRPVPQGQTVVDVVAPRSATGQLNWISIRGAAAPRLGLNESVHNYASGTWENAPERAADINLLVPSLPIR